MYKNCDHELEVFDTENCPLCRIKQLEATKKYVEDWENFQNQFRRQVEKNNKLTEQKQKLREAIKKADILLVKYLMHHNDPRVQLNVINAGHILQKALKDK